MEEMKDEELDDILDDIDPSNKIPTFFRKAHSEYFPTAISLWIIFVEYGIEKYAFFHMRSKSQRIGEYVKMGKKMKRLIKVLKKPWTEWGDTQEIKNILEGLENDDFLGVKSIS